MTVSELIKELQQFDGNQEIQCLYKTSDWMSGDDGSFEIETCEWTEVEGVALRKYSGDTMLSIYGCKSDLEYY